MRGRVESVVGLIKPHSGQFKPSRLHSKFPRANALLTDDGQSLSDLQPVSLAWTGLKFLFWSSLRAQTKET